jgi:hypothetical protein
MKPRRSYYFVVLIWKMINPKWQTISECRGTHEDIVVGGRAGCHHIGGVGCRDLSEGKNYLRRMVQTISNDPHFL